MFSTVYSLKKMKNKTEITTMSKPKYNLLSLLKHYEIEVPKLQRDYAQGREDAHSRAVRERFVKDLWEVLREGKELNLDLVYGYQESNKLILIDGQQRLTTLWLLYWYIAWKSEKTPSEEVDDSKRKVVDDLKRFTYETRVSSRDFMKKLLDWKPADRNAIKNIGETIKNQTWFLASWAQDPTINSMLTMLNQFDEQEKGETIGEDIDYLARLEKITFSFLDMGDFKLGDDLYIKMNGRGLPLTPFENFKADLLEHIKGDKGEAEEYGKWLDGDFLDFFWKIAQTSEKSENVPPPDPLMMEFVNRFWVWKSIEKSIENEENEDGNEQKENIVDKFSVPYESFAIYENFAGRAALDEMQRLLTFIRKLGVSKSEDEQEKWGPGLETGGAWDVPPGQKVLPSFNEKSAGITYAGRCIFAAICLYVEKTWNKEQKESEINSDHFRKWMRICWNITENTNTDSYEGMYNCIGLLMGLSKCILRDGDVYKALGRLNENNIESLGPVQKRVLREEIEKAKVFGDYEETILKAEARFKGAIFFLFASGYDNNDGFTIKPEHWEKFDGKWETICCYVEETGGSTPEKWAKFLRNMFSLLDTNDSLLEGCPIFDCSSDGLLLKKVEYLNLVYRTLSAENFDKEKDEKEFRDILKQTEVSSNTILKNMPYEIIKDIIEKVVSAEKRNYALYGESNVWIVYRKHKGNQSYYNDRLVLSKESIDRYAILKDCLEMGEVKMEKLTRWGYNSYFKYKEVNYTWTIPPFNDGGNKLNRIYKNNDREKRNDVPVRCQDKDEDVGEIQVDSEIIEIKELIQKAIDRRQKDLRSQLNN